MTASKLLSQLIPTRHHNRWLCLGFWLDLLGLAIVLLSWLLSPLLGAMIAVHVLLSSGGGQ